MTWDEIKAEIERTLNDRGIYEWAVNITEDERCHEEHYADLVIEARWPRDEPPLLRICKSIRKTSEQPEIDLSEDCWEGLDVLWQMVAFEALEDLDHARERNRRKN